MIFYNSWSAWMRCSTCCFPTYLIPKSSTMRMKDMIMYLWFHSTGATSTGWYLCFSRCFFNLLCVILPDFGRPYMPFQISILTVPLCEISVRLYLNNNILGYDVKRKLHVLLFFHWCVEIIFFYICTQKSGIRCWDGAVDESFGCCDICCGSFDSNRAVN